MLDVRDAAHSSRAIAHGALNVPVPGSSFATKAGFLLDRDDDRRPGVEHGRGRARDSRVPLCRLPRARGLRARRRLGAIEPVDLDELDALLEDGAELIDVRERDERDNGYIAGSRNIPYRLLPSAAPTSPPTGRS